MKQLLLTTFGLLFLFQAFGQIKLTWESVDIVDETTISVKVFAQNLGQRTALWNKYANAPDDEREELNFHVEYDFIPNGKHIVLPPSSITIKTIFGGSVAMETPVYYFDPTGTNSGERWEIIFYQLPRESGNVMVKILGEKRLVGDMPLADKARKVVMDKFLLEKDTKTFDYKEFYPQDYKDIENKIIQSVYDFSIKNKIANAIGKVSLIIDKDGVSIFKGNLSSIALNDHLQNKFGSGTLKSTTKLGYKVSAQADYDIVYSNGEVKIKKDNGELVSSNLELPELLKSLFEKITYKFGKYKITYNLLFINKQLTESSTFKIEDLGFFLGDKTKYNSDLMDYANTMIGRKLEH